MISTMRNFIYSLNYSQVWMYEPRESSGHLWDSTQMVVYNGTGAHGFHVGLYHMWHRQLKHEKFALRLWSSINCDKKIKYIFVKKFKQKWTRVMDLMDKQILNRRLHVICPVQVLPNPVTSSVQVWGFDSVICIEGSKIGITSLRSISKLTHPFSG